MFVIAGSRPELLDRWREALVEDRSIVEVRRFEALAECLTLLQPQVLLLDLRLMRPGVLREIEQMLKASPGTRIIVFTDECDEEHELALFKAGVRGVCALDSSGNVLARIVDAVLQGELWIRRGLVPKLVASVRASGTETGGAVTGRFAILTPREFEITRLVGEGVSNKRIARHLAIAERTVKGHLTAIFRKTGIVDRVKLALVVARRR